MHSKSGKLAARQPFDFKRSLEFVRGSAPTMGEQSVEGGRLTKAIMVEGQPVAFSVWEEGEGVGYTLFAEEELEERVAEEAAKRISFYLSLDDDLGPFYSIAREKDPGFYPVVEREWGLHQVKSASLLEAACWALINQRIQRATALRIKRSLTERFGGGVQVGGMVYRAFPDLSRLKGATPTQLLEMTRNQRVTQRLVSLLSFPEVLDEAFLRTAPYQKADERLQTVKGIGDWSAQLVLLRGLGRMGRLQELNLRPLGGVIEEVYGAKGVSVEEAGRLYGGWAGYWLLYLWATSMKRDDPA